MKNNKKGFSVLMAIFFIGFLLVLVIGTFNLLIRDMNDNRWEWNYLKAYAWAEWAMELWLLKIKKEGYWIDKDLNQSNSGILSFSGWNKKTYPKISYKMDIWVNTLTWQKIWPGKTVIIPLFSNNNYVTKPNFTDNTSWNDIIWNIIWKKWWMSWSGSFDYSNSIYYKTASWTYDTKTIEDFLWENTWSYLMLFNKSNSDTWTYNLSSSNNFSKPVWKVISSVKVWRYKQNIVTNIDNTEFLNMLKYSIFSR